MDTLTKEDLDLILESLKHMKRTRQDSKDHPDPEFKRSQIEAVESVEVKIRAMKKSASD